MMGLPLSLTATQFSTLVDLPTALDGFTQEVSRL
jgi:hypothetical protein